MSRFFFRQPCSWMYAILHASNAETVLDKPCCYSMTKNKEAFLTPSHFLIELQVQLKVFRAKWMSELKLSSGASGMSDRLLKTKGLRKTQEIAREEKVSCDISLG